MARDTARDLDGDSFLDRRSYLKLASTTAATLAAGVAGTATAAEYETITVPAGQKRNITVGDGETFENVLIDMTTDGASAQITTSGSNWTIRNVGFMGEHPGGHRLLTPGVADANGTGLVENVYMGDGQVPRTASGAVWVNANLPHRGTITFRNVHIAGFIDNGLYGSGPGAQGYGGNLHVETSYFKANTISNIRLNAKEHPCQVSNTVVDARGNDPCGTGCSAPGSTTTRAIWSWYGETHLRNCDIVGSIATTKGGSVTKTNTRTGDAADLTPPKGVPTSAKQAAKGGGKSGGNGTSGNGGAKKKSGGKNSSGKNGGKSNGAKKGTAKSDGNRTQAFKQQSAKMQGVPNVVSIASANADGPASYELRVSGKLRKSTERGASKNAEDAVDGSSATGKVAGGTDSYRFGGDVTKLDVEGKATVFLNGERVSPGDVGLPKTLVVDGSNDPDDEARYSFDVSGDVAKSADLGTVNAFDTVEGKRVKGRVIDKRDGYRFSGALTRIEVEGTANVHVGAGE